MLFQLTLTKNKNIGQLLLQWNEIMALSSWKCMDWKWNLYDAVYFPGHRWRGSLAQIHGCGDSACTYSHCFILSISFLHSLLFCVFSLQQCSAFSVQFRLPPKLAEAYGRILYIASGLTGKCNGPYAVYGRNPPYPNIVKVGRQAWCTYRPLGLLYYIDSIGVFGKNCTKIETFSLHE